MGAPDFSDFPTQVKGHTFEDFAVGNRYDHHWGRTLTEADNTIFSTATCSWVPMYLNVEYARAHGHPSTVVNPLLVLCTAVGLSVEDLSESGGPFLGLNECRFLHPLYAGDTITAASTVLDCRLSDSRPGTGIVSWRTTVTNQHEEIVLEYCRTNLVACRGDAR